MMVTIFLLYVNLLIAPLVTCVIKVSTVGGCTISSNLSDEIVFTFRDGLLTAGAEVQNNFSDSYFLYEPCWVYRSHSGRPFKYISFEVCWVIDVGQNTPKIEKCPR